MRLPSLSHYSRAGARLDGGHWARPLRRKRPRFILPEPLARLWDVLLGPPPAAQAATIGDTADHAPRAAFSQNDATPAEGESIQIEPRRDQQTPAGEREQAAALIADALLKAEELVFRSSRGADPRLVADTVAALRSLGEYLERSTAALAAERSQLEAQVHTVQTMVEDLTGLVHALRETGLQPTLPGGPPPVEKVKAEQPPLLFTPERPLTLRIHGVTDFRLLVRLERALSGHEAVQSAAIESYQGEQARFVLALRSPLTSEGLRATLAAELGREVVVEAATPGAGELDLQLGPEAAVGLP